MASDELLKTLCCPTTRQRLQLATGQLLAELNQQVDAGTLRTCGGSLVRERLEAGLVRQDGQILFPVRHHIPVMLEEEAILLTSDQVIKRIVSG